MFVSYLQRPSGFLSSTDPNTNSFLLKKTKSRQTSILITLNQDEWGTVLC